MSPNKPRDRQQDRYQFITGRLSSQEQAWLELLTMPDEAQGPVDHECVISSSKQAQRMDGFGGAFSERSWQILMRVAKEKREEVMGALFSPQTGCGLEHGRIPIGANDFALDWYSHDEVPGDFSLHHFDIARDHLYLIPFIHAAQKYNPALRLWASPWSPPAWMKRNSHYACQSDPDRNDLPPDGQIDELSTAIRMEPAVLSAYADYFIRFLDAYRDQGVRIEAVHIQNEPNSCQVFPSCVWHPKDLEKFISNYLGPLMKQKFPDVELWLGTIERPDLDRILPLLENPDCCSYLGGVGFQWAGLSAIAPVHQRFPELALMQTETECGTGTNDWAAAAHTWQLIHRSLTDGVTRYMAWNLVLNPDGLSTWGWRQNTLITLEEETGEIRYNPEFYLFMHLSHFIRAGDHRLNTAPDLGQLLAFIREDGSIILTLFNPDSAAKSHRLIIDGHPHRLTLPPQSFMTTVWQKEPEP